MKHFSEEELIAYQLQESLDEIAISRHLEGCSECANLSEAIAETLRVFSADPVLTPDLEKNWQRLRSNFEALDSDGVAPSNSHDGAGRGLRSAWLLPAW